MSVLLDLDVAVVGAGAAGLAAATRVRFVKSFEAAPLSAIVLDGGPPGGLLGAATARLVTGPSFSLNAPTLREALLTDMRELEIPVIHSRVVRVDATGDRFELSTLDGTRVRASSVVLATGSRPLGNEFGRLGDGVFVSYKGTSFLAGMLQAARAHAGHLPLAVVTRRPSRLETLLRQVAGPLIVLAPATDLVGLPDDVPEGCLPCDSLRLVEYGGPGLRLALEPAGEMSCGALFLDYLSFQWRPLLPALGFALEEIRPGVPSLDATLQTSHPGLFLAGDVACRQASLASALGDGVTAGFGAYRHAFQAQFGRAPSLFAYRPPAPGTDLTEELPRVRPTDRLRWLVGTARRTGWLAEHDGRTLDAIALATGRGFDQVAAAVATGMREKTLTVRRIPSYEEVA